MDITKEYIKRALRFEVHQNYRDFRDIPDLHGHYNGKAVREAMQAYDHHEELQNSLLHSLLMVCKTLKEKPCPKSDDC